MHGHTSFDRKRLTTDQLITVRLHHFILSKKMEKTSSVQCFSQVGWVIELCGRASHLVFEVSRPPLLWKFGKDVETCEAKSWKITTKPQGKETWNSYFHERTCDRDCFGNKVIKKRSNVFGRWSSRKMMKLQFQFENFKSWGVILLAASRGQSVAAALLVTQEFPKNRINNV